MSSSSTEINTGTTIAKGESTLTTTDITNNNDLSLASTVVKVVANSIFTFIVFLPVIVTIGGKQKSKKLNK
jgi:hypothetical protein